MKKIWVDLGLVLLLAAGVFLFLKFPYSIKSGFPQEEEIPEWLPSPLISHPHFPVSLYTFFDEETRSRQIYLFQGDLVSFDHSISIRLTASEGDKSGPVWGPDLDEREGCNGPSFFYQADDLTQRNPTPMPQVACLSRESLSETPRLVFERLLTVEEVPEIRIEGIELGQKTIVPNMENSPLFFAQKQEGSFLALLQCDKMILLPLPQGIASQNAVYWGGTSESKKYLEAIFEVTDESNRNLVYYKKSLADCTSAGEALSALEETWDSEVALTCGGDNRNASLILPTRDQPDPRLYFFKVDVAGETAVPSVLDLKKRIAKPCECAADGDCDDGNMCTADTCKENLCDYVKEDPVCCNTDDECGEKVCVNHSCSEKQVPTGACQDDAGCASQEDGNLCNGKLYCDKSSPDPDEWKCKVNPGTVVIPCGTSSDTACLKNTCNPQTGKCSLTPVMDGITCNDGEKCTKPDLCKAGQCQMGAWDFTDPECQCRKDDGVDCAKHEDGNLCNGTLYCDMSVHQCKLNPATIKKCPSADDTACVQNLCDAKTGQCMMTPAGYVCDDGNPCTMDDKCLAGKCAAGQNVCECQVDADCAAKNKENLCQFYYCDKNEHACVLNPSSIKQCATVDDTGCSKNTCNPKNGNCEMTPLKDGITCDADGTYCTKEDSCLAGKCIPGEMDKQLCECQKDIDCPDDGDLCNGIPYCHVYMPQNPGEIPAFQCKNNPATVVTCSSSGNTQCKVTYCQKQTGKCVSANANEGQGCEDENPCTQGDLCSAGLCMGGSNVCECQANADCAKFEDKDLCNGTLFCNKETHKCQVNPATIVTLCGANTPCNPETGKCQAITLP